MMKNTITVNVGDLNVALNGDTLVTYALGSCVGICLYDKQAKIAGLSHILLPSSNGFSAQHKPEKFADKAIVLLVTLMQSKGANPSRITAKIAGGAKMFAVSGNNSLSSIGNKNILAVKLELSRLHIPILAQDTGKNFGRTQYFAAADGLMTIKSFNNGIHVF